MSDECCVNNGSAPITHHSSLVTHHLPITHHSSLVTHRSSPSPTKPASLRRGRKGRGIVLDELLQLHRPFLPDLAHDVADLLILPGPHLIHQFQNSIDIPLRN